MNSGVLDLYEVGRRLLAVAAFKLPAVEELRFEGWSFEHASVAIMVVLLIIAAIKFRSNVEKRLEPIDPSAVSPRDGRRYRLIPDPLGRRLESEIAAVWKTTRTTKSRPRLYCFAAPSVIACALSDGGSAAIAVSTGLLERLAKGSDALLRVIFRHEVGHVLYSDQNRLPKAEALISVLRTTMAALVGTVVAISLTWIVLEKVDLGGLGGPDASTVAYLRDTIMPAAFTYGGLIVLARYLSLIFMLLELRADLMAVQLGGGIQSFVAAVAGDVTIRHSGWAGIRRSLFSLRVSHLSPRERIEILTSPDRLLTPKLRYFAISLMLPVALMITGRRGMTASSEAATMAFDWVISGGMTGVVIALNVAVVLMILNVRKGGCPTLTTRRMVQLVAVVAAVNLFLHWDEYAVINRVDEWLTAVLDPNFREPWSQSIQRAAAVGHVLGEPFLGPLLNGRLLAWMLALYCVLVGTERLSSRVASPLLSWSVAFAVVLGTIWERLSVNDVPFFSFPRMLHDHTGWTLSISRWCGPVTSFVIVLPILFLVYAADALGRRARSAARQG